MARTKSELAVAVLQELGVIGAGETPSAEDDVKADFALENVHARLEVRGYTTYEGTEWTIDTVPDFAAKTYIIIAANELVNVFGASDSLKLRLEKEYQAAIPMLLGSIRVPAVDEHEDSTVFY